MPNIFDQIHEEQTKAQAPAPAAAPPPVRPETWAEKAGIQDIPVIPGLPVSQRDVVDAVEGAASGAASTLFHAGDLIRRGLGMKRVIDNPDVQQAMTAPPTPAGQAGKYGEQAAEFLVPAGAVGKAGRAVEVATQGARGGKVLAGLGKAALEGLSTGAVTTAQTGDVNEGVKQGAIGAGTSGVAQGVGVGLSKALPFVRSRMNAVEQAAMDWAEKHGVRLSTGQRTGNRMVSKMERGLENTFGSSGRTQEFFQGQESELEAAGRDLVNRTQPGRSMNPFEAGENLGQRVKGVIDDAKANADTIYSDIRSDFAKHAKSVQVGVDKSGQPIMETMELPVDLTNAKIKLIPIYEELKRTMPEAKRQMSPGFQALHELVNGPDVLDAATADRNLSAIKAIARGGNNQFLNSRSQGIAKAAIGSIEGDLNAALSAADPAIVPKLQQARALVRKQHTVAEILNSLPDEPAALYQRMTTAGDRTFNDLSFLNNIAPQEMRQVGRTYLDGLFQKATTEGGFNRAAGVMADWQRLGPKTKLLMFGNQQAVSELDKFFLAAKRLTQDPNPSGTGKLISTLGILGAGIDAIRTPGTIEDKAERFGVDAGSLAVTSNVLSRLLLSPGGARLLTRTLTAPKSSVVLRQAAAGVMSMLTRDEKKQLEQAQQQPAKEEPMPAAEATPAEQPPAPEPKQFQFNNQTFTEGQEITSGGKRYKVIGVNPETGKLKVEPI